LTLSLWPFKTIPQAKAVMEQKKPSLKDRITPAFIREGAAVFKESGFRGVIKRYGWKFFAFFFTYYLIRDLTLYVFLPWYLAKKLL
jgi:hypothetical protein